MTPTESEYAGRLRTAMLAGTKQAGPITIRQLSAAVGSSYEHVRKVLTGEPVVSPSLNQKLCEFLRLDVQEMWRLAAREKTRRRFGDLALRELEGPKDKRFSALWERLGETDKRRLLEIAEIMVLAAEARRHRDRHATAGTRKRG